MARLITAFIWVPYARHAVPGATRRQELYWVEDAEVVKLEARG